MYPEIKRYISVKSNYAWTKNWIANKIFSLSVKFNSLVKKTFNDLSLYMDFLYKLLKN